MIPSRHWGYAHRVLRRLLLILLLPVAGQVGCQTYRADLNRAQRYYEDNQYAQALALFRALERDTDSLSVHEQARYAYFRGMTDYRLARVEGTNDARFDRHARYWLGIATAIEKEHPGGLQEHEQKRLSETLQELNAKVYGTSEDFDPAPVATPPDPNAPATESPAAVPGAPAKACEVSSDCPENFICQDGACVQL